MSITLRADDFGGPYCLSPTFGNPVCQVTAQYKNGGIVFGGAIPGGVSGVVPVATIADGGVLDSWAGVNGANTIDLLTQVNMQIVIPGTTTQGVTTAFSVEAGLSATDALLLSAYDVNGTLLGTRLNGHDGLGPDGRSIITLINLVGAAFFTVALSGLFPVDTFAVNEIDIPGVDPAPAPAVVSVPPFVNWVSFPAGPLCGGCPGDLGMLRRLKNRLYYALTKGPVRLE